jgi:hypothetical protein
MERMDTRYAFIEEYIIRALPNPRIATIYEVILFGFALYKYVEALDLSRLPAAKKVMILTRVLVNDNILYFVGYGFVVFFRVPRHERIFRVTIVLLLNNLEVSVSKSFESRRWLELTSIVGQNQNTVVWLWVNLSLSL